MATAFFMSSNLPIAYYVTEGGENMREHSSGCSVMLGSVTQAMRAQNILGEAAIPTTLIKQDSSQSGSRGCVYGLSYSCSQTKNVKTVLTREKVKVKQWNGEI